MLRFPASQTSAQFLQRYWQKAPLFMPAALEGVRPAVTRNELAWLATLDDVEARIVFVERGKTRTRYRVETGPFDPEYLKALPRRDWTLLVHDVEKHLPGMRGLFRHVAFIPDWRIDDLMVSFAAPGGGVGPHRDHYDVFLCQGIGIREWRFTLSDVDSDTAASTDLSLLSEFDGDESHATQSGDVLYIPPGVAHWGTARRACMTYSIGMRAPQVSDLVPATRVGQDTFYSDPDLTADEARPGYISGNAAQRLQRLFDFPAGSAPGRELGRFATRTKSWLKPDTVSSEQVDALADDLLRLGKLDMHGMARIAYDDANIYANGASRPLTADMTAPVALFCDQRAFKKEQLRALARSDGGIALFRWLLSRGAFDLSESHCPYVK